jgi:hypothetical protein
MAHREEARLNLSKRCSMPRSDSPGFLRANALHLFSRLRNPAALRLNPLVANVFYEGEDAALTERGAAAVVEIRKRILRAAEVNRKLDIATRDQPRGERQYTIVVRCELNREPRKVVAQDLGISTRQFSRERHQARLRIAKLLEEWNTQSVSTVVDLEGATLAHAIVLDELGDSSDAVVELREFASASTTPNRVVQALTMLAAIHRDFDRLDEAETVVREAEHAALAGGDGAQTLVSRVQLLQAQTELAVERGEFVRADTGFEKLASIIPCMGLNLPGAPEAAAQALCALAWRESEHGRLSNAVLHVATALSVLSAATLPPVLLRAKLLRLQGVVLYHTGAIERVTAQARLLDLLRSAQAAGWLKQSALLFGALAVDVDGSTNAHAYCGEARRLSYQHGSTQLQRIAHLASSVLAVTHLDWVQAQVELRESQLHGAGSDFERIVVADVQARLAIANGNPRAALPFANDAYGTAAKVGNDRVRGTAMRTMAMLQLSLGHRFDASDLIDGAIPIIKLHGSPSSLQLALSVRDQISSAS